MQLLHPKEEEIMSAIWEIGHPCVISEILKTHPTLKRNTVAKVLIILEQKGYLKVDSIIKTVTRTGRGYAPVIREENYLAQKELIGKIVESPSAEKGIVNYISGLLQTPETNKEFFDELETLIADYKSPGN